MIHQTFGGIVARFAQLHRFFITLMFAGALAAHAQVVGGTISGIVRDANGATLSGATVTVRQIETGATRTLTTDDEGRFFAPSVPVGTFSVTSAHDGFEPQVQSGIALTVGQSLRLSFTLGLEKVQQQIEVDAVGASVNTTTQQTSGLIDEKQVKELPFNGRSYDTFVTAKP